MTSRMDFEDAVIMAFSYMQQASPIINIISYDEIKEFKRVVESNLGCIDSRAYLPFGFSDESTESTLYFRGVDLSGEIYIMLNPTTDVKCVMDKVFGHLPCRIILASQQPNALKTINLELVDGKFKITTWVKIHSKRIPI